MRRVQIRMSEICSVVSPVQTWVHLRCVCEPKEQRQGQKDPLHINSADFNRSRASPDDALLCVPGCSWPQLQMQMQMQMQMVLG